ncbi:hypothetical protein UlMin_045993 [Ulmus minor]
MVGIVQEVECNQDELCLGTFIRVHVVIDISKPLKRILKVRLGANKELVTILLRYEHLPELCFQCGLFGHPLKECPDRAFLHGDNIKLKYGAWIKAPIPSPGETSQQNKRRRPSSGISPHAPRHGNSIKRQPYTAATMIRQPSQLGHRHGEQPNHFNISTSRPPPATQKTTGPNWVCKDKVAITADFLGIVAQILQPMIKMHRLVKLSLYHQWGLLLSVSSRWHLQNPCVSLQNPSHSPLPLQEKRKNPTISLIKILARSLSALANLSFSVILQELTTSDTMNILVWNVQGLGNDWTFQILHDYVQQYSPSLVFLSETLSTKAQMERLRVRLGFSGMLTWDREGRSGGLCLFWSDSIHVQLLSGSRGHIDVKVTSHDSTCWRFSGLYGNPDTSLKTQFWTLLKRLGDVSSMPWLCGGDLNEILFGHEKQGGAARAQYLMNAFREATSYCGLTDLGFRGPKFTWIRGKNACLVQERLDRMLGNGGWLEVFPNSLVHHLNLRGSDHRPLLVELLRVDDSTAANLDGVANKLRLCATDLESWNVASFRRLKTQVRKAKTAFDRVDRNLSNQNWKEHLRLERTLDALRYKEERYWKQRSKDLWLKCGDKNSKFFHQNASARKSKNTITGLIDQNGQWCEKEEGLAHIIESYFKSLFTSSSPSATNFNQVLDSIETKITPQLNGQLEQAFEAEDVRTVVFQMAPTKSPGADGMSAIFYKKFWPIVGEEVTAACLGFVNGGHPLGSINETIITFLPKIKNPTRITEFRPISLCNVLYKIISKMLANRLRKIMDSVISQEQSAFIPGRLISDNAIIGFECLHAIKRQKTKKNYLALKLDMAKAYDRVEWGFIYKIMIKLGFSEVWTNKIMACISSVSYSFQFNGQRVGHLIPSRGLRQGNPLSPYLFLLCGEGLSSLLHHYEQSGDLQGLRCGLRGPTISHLFFADDNLLFIEEKTSACYALKEVLNFYEAASGQAVNLSKSAVCFGPNLPEADAVNLTACLGVPRVRCHEKYLGLPCYAGKNKHGIFSSIKDRVWNKLCGWKSKLLSTGGREVLSKLIIQAIPAYAMSLFKIPSTLINELHRLCAQFWWGGGGGGGAIRKRGGYIGALGRNFVAINWMVVWDSET